MYDGRVVCVVPALNEEESVGQVVRELVGRGYEVLVVDDGSGDATAQVARSAGAHVLSLPFNLGIGGAVQTGFKWAARNGYEIALQVDADGQHPPEHIEKLLEPLRAGEAEVVIGSRYVEKTGYRTPVGRRMGMLAVSAAVWLATGKRVRDVTSGFRAYSRKAFTRLAEDYPTDFPEPEALVLLHKWGLRTVEVAVDMEPRRAGRSSIGWWKASFYMFRVMLGVALTRVRAR